MSFIEFVQGIGTKAKGIAAAIQGLTRTQAIIAGVVTVTAVGGVGTGGYFLYDHFHQPEPAAIVADVIIETEAEEPTEELVTEVEEVTEATEVAAEPETVNLVGSSIEKDLKIKIQDKASKNVKGQPFEISVKADKKNAKATTYSDTDKDGIIYIKSIEAGKYKVSLNEIEGFVSKENEYSVTVKDKIEYKEVAVKDEIKTEAEVAPAEDAETNNVEVEAVVKDTVETLDSTCTPAKVGSGDVDTSNFPKAEVGGASKVDIAQASGTAVAKNISYRASSNVNTQPSEGTKSTEGETPSTGGQGNGATGGTGNGTTGENSNGTTGENGSGTTGGNGSGPTEGEGETSKPGDGNGSTGGTGSTGTPSTENKGDGNGSTETGEDKKPEGTEHPEEKTYTYQCTYIFYVDGNKVTDETKTRKDLKETQTVFKASEADSYSKYAEKYTLEKADPAEATATVDKPQKEIRLYWKTKVAAAKASVSIPQTATLYNSAINNANTLALAASITDEGSIIKEISWSSSDEKIVKVTNGARTGCTITAAGKGSATVTATITYLTTPGDTQKTANDKKITCTITVKDYSGNSTTQLKDKSGRGLYKDSECKTPATLSDYKEGATYYTEPQYTGWQTIDGKVYYYNSNHQRVTGSQVISGITYTFGSDGSLQQGSGKNGIDVSSHQGNIDWSSVKAAGINFAIIRVGYRGSQSGVLVEDSRFKKNIQGATAAGINVGVYFFTQAVTEAEAVEEASMALSLCSGYNLAYPIFVDTENGSGGARANGLDKATRTACVSAFCKTVANGGRKAGVYASKSWYNNKIDASAFSSYFIWVAQYNTTCTYKGKYNMWQYSSKGSVPGIKGNVDVNIAY